MVIMVTDWSDIGVLTKLYPDEIEEWLFSFLKKYDSFRNTLLYPIMFFNIFEYFIVNFYFHI